MKIGLFVMPMHPPGRDLLAAHRWDLDVIQLADELGYAEAWIGEHFCVPWEPICAPDLMIAQALLRTEQIKLAPGAHLLPFHHPVELAHRVAYLDHLSEGRLMLGIGAGSSPADFAMFNIDGVGGQNREMMREALDIMVRLWAETEPFDFVGKYWNASKIAPMCDGLLYQHIKPLQDPHPRIGIAGLSPRSDTLRIAGERGYIPLSLHMNSSYLQGHWEAYSEGATGSGRSADRSDWRVTKDIFVADTDAEAKRWSARSEIGRAYDEYALPLFRQFGFTGLFKHDQSVADADVTTDYLVDSGHMLVGSVDTVVERIEELAAATGGFGTLMQLVYDYSEEPGPWRYSMELLANEVMPRVKHLAPEGVHTIVPA